MIRVDRIQHPTEQLNTIQQSQKPAVWGRVSIYHVYTWYRVSQQAQNILLASYPANTKHMYNIFTMLAQRLVFTGMVYHYISRLLMHHGNTSIWHSYELKMKWNEWGFRPPFSYGMVSKVVYNTDLESQKAVAAYSKSKQLLYFSFAKQGNSDYDIRNNDFNYSPRQTRMIIL